METIKGLWRYNQHVWALNEGAGGDPHCKQTYFLSLLITTRGCLISVAALRLHCLFFMLLLH